MTFAERAPTRNWATESAVPHTVRTVTREFEFVRIVCQANRTKRLLRSHNSTRGRAAVKIRKRGETKRQIKPNTAESKFTFAHHEWWLLLFAINKNNGSKFLIFLNKFKLVHDSKHSKKPTFIDFLGTRCSSHSIVCQFNQQKPIFLCSFFQIWLISYSTRVKKWKSSCAVVFCSNGMLRLKNEEHNSKSLGSCWPQSGKRNTTRFLWKGHLIKQPANCELRWKHFAADWLVFLFHKPVKEACLMNLSGWQTNITRDENLQTM